MTQSTNMPTYRNLFPLSYSSSLSGYSDDSAQLQDSMLFTFSEFLK